MLFEMSLNFLFFPYFFILTNKMTMAATTHKIARILFIENTNSCPIIRSKIGGFTKKMANMNKMDAVIDLVVFFISPSLT